MLNTINLVIRLLVNLLFDNHGLFHMSPCCEADLHQRFRFLGYLIAMRLPVVRK
jgi:hypothetical protein